MKINDILEKQFEIINNSLKYKDILYRDKNIDQKLFTRLLLNNSYIKEDEYELLINNFKFVVVKNNLNSEIKDIKSINNKLFYKNILNAPYFILLFIKRKKNTFVSGILSKIKIGLTNTSQIMGLHTFWLDLKNEDSSNRALYSILMNNFLGNHSYKEYELYGIFPIGYKEENNLKSIKLKNVIDFKIDAEENHDDNDLQKELLDDVLKLSDSSYLIFDVQNGLISYNNNFIKLFDLDFSSMDNFEIYNIIDAIYNNFKHEDKIRNDFYKSLENDYYEFQENLLKPVKTHIVFKSVKILKKNTQFENTNVIEGIYIWNFIDNTDKHVLESKNKKLNSYIKKVNKKSKQIQDELIRCSRMADLGHLISGIAHEINTPLGAINSNIDIFSRQFLKLKTMISSVSKKDDASGNKLNQIIDRLFDTLKLNKVAIQRIKEIVEGLKIASRKGKVEKTKVNVEESINSTLSIVCHELKNIQVKKNYGNVSNIIANSGQINQIFTNIIVNAAHSIEHNEGSIDISTIENRNSVIVKISDNGHGINPRIIRRIFRKGFTTKEESKGMGIGLYIVKNIIDEHKGQIDVDSVNGKGTTFTITLPKK